MSEIQYYDWQAKLEGGRVWTAQEVSAMFNRLMDMESIAKAEDAQIARLNELVMGWRARAEAAEAELARVTAQFVTQEDVDAAIAELRGIVDGVAADRNALQAALERAREADRWIPVEERLPENNQYVLGMERSWWGPRYTAWWYHHDLRTSFIRDFSHWREMPEPPQAALDAAGGG